MSLSKLILCLLIVPVTSMGSVVLNATRVIFPGNKTEMTLDITNNNSTPVLVQSWVDDINSDIKNGIQKTPFMIIPPMVRIEEEQGQMLRIIYDNTPLPKDKESIYLINVLEIPPKNGDDNNVIQLSFRNRIKLIYRPSEIGTPDFTEITKKITCKMDSGSDHTKTLVCKNPTPYYISLGESIITDGSNSIVLPISKFGMISPFGELKTDFRLDNLNAKSSKLVYQVINDYGSYNSFETKVN